MPLIQSNMAISLGGQVYSAENKYRVNYNYHFLVQILGSEGACLTFSKNVWIISEEVGVINKVLVQGFIALRKP